MKYTIHILTAGLLGLTACTTESESTVIDVLETELDSSNFEVAEVLEPEIDAEQDYNSPMDTFNGQWFSIAYPEDFIPHPDLPLDTFDDYEYVVTDEAVFAAPNGDVEFFVFSPQWGGNPESYWDALPNEEIESEKTTVDEIDPNRVYRWVTFKDKKGIYQRSYYSKRTESTHLVFGIKYKDQATYDAFKPAYDAFKNSLQQYAD